jgi:hypothetical protein
MRELVLGMLVFLLSSATALSAGKIYYGSRAGMTVTVVAKSGIGGENSVIRTRHTRQDAIGFCREYVGKVSRKCIEEELATALGDEIKGNCVSGRFTNFFGEDHQFEGEVKPGRDDMSAKYAIRNIATGEIANGSSASGYPTNMGIFRALCPAKAPDQSDEYHRN